ncbi:hypothetical protein [Spirosoma gilvum]
MKTICASLLFASLTAAITPVCLAGPGINQPLNNPIYSSRNYKQPYSTKWEDRSSQSINNWAYYNTKLADYKHPVRETDLPIGSIASDAENSVLVNRNYKMQHDTTWQPAYSEQDHPLRKYRKHHPHTVGN